MRVNLRELRDALDYLKSINSTDLEDIEWYIDDYIITPPEDSVQEWRYVGLNNTEFARNVLMKALS